MHRRIPLLNLRDSDLIAKMNKKEILLGLDIKSDFKSANYNQFVNIKEDFRFKLYHNLNADNFTTNKSTIAVQIVEGVTYDRYNYVHRRAGDVIYLPIYALVLLIKEEKYTLNQVDVGDFFFI